MESYLREKKEAILEDRKLDIGLAAKGPRIMLKDHDDDDQKSCLQQVQDRYADYRDDVNEDANMRRSHISQTASAVARSGAPQSLTGSAALLRERLAQDFGIGVNKDADANSVVSGLDDEVDEWAALNKYAVLRSYQDRQALKISENDRKIAMR